MYICIYVCIRFTPIPIYAAPVAPSVYLVYEPAASSVMLAYLLTSGYSAEGGAVGGGCNGWG